LRPAKTTAFDFQGNSNSGATIMITKREKEIVNFYIKMFLTKKMMQKDIGKHFGLSGTRVHQIVEQASRQNKRIRTRLEKHYDKIWNEKFEKEFATHLLNNATQEQYDEFYNYRRQRRAE
jgi:hypothetical protein